MSSLVRWTALILLCPSLLFAKPPEADPAIYGPQPSGNELASILRPLFSNSLLRSPLAESMNMDSASVSVTGGAIQPWCYPNHASTYCGWLATFVFTVDAVSANKKGFSKIKFPSSDVSIFFRNGKPLAWQGAIYDNRQFNPLKLSFTAIESDGKAEAVAVDVFHPTFLFVNEKTGALIELKLSVAKEFKGWRRACYNDESYVHLHSLQYGFYLFLALEEAGFHRVDHASKQPDYVIDNIMLGLTNPTFSYRTTAHLSLSITNKTSIVSKKDFEATAEPNTPYWFNIDKSVSAMNIAMADAAEQEVLYIKEQLGTQIEKISPSAISQ